MAENRDQDGSIFLVKDCPECGETKTLVSTDPVRYYAKHKLDHGCEPKGCVLNCPDCDHKQAPTLVFIDITNRCNMNCPICINNTPSMGYTFEPPIEYFEKIFAHYAKMDNPPAIQLFGGEPTVRKDLFELLDLGRKKYKLRFRLVTNGLKLADREYCEEIIKRKTTILLAYDGENPKLYDEIRGMPKSLELKHQALDNIREIGGAKTTFMTLVSRDYNMEQLHDIFDFAHEYRSTVRATYLMPLAHSWEKEDWDYDPERTTTEDLENAVDRAYPERDIHFLPAGLLGQLPNIKKGLRIKPLPFLGAHPNCESIYLLVSDDERYQPIENYLKGDITDLAADLIDLDDKIAPKMEKWENGAFGRFMKKIGLGRGYLVFRTGLSLRPLIKKHVHVGRLFKGKGIGKWWHAFAAAIRMVFGAKTDKVRTKHTNVGKTLQIIILPFEDRYCIETERLERCPAEFAYVDPDDDAVKSVPVCAWGLHKDNAMRKISEATKALAE